MLGRQYDARPAAFKHTASQTLGLPPHLPLSHRPLPLTPYAGSVTCPPQQTHAIQAFTCEYYGQPIQVFTCELYSQPRRTLMSWDAAARTRCVSSRRSLSDFCSRAIMADMWRLAQSFYSSSSDRLAPSTPLHRTSSFACAVLNLR